LRSSAGVIFSPPSRAGAMLGAALFCAAQQNRPLDFRFGSDSALPRQSVTCPFYPQYLP
jgi:hypothetical protein